jgi:hypothetical protein
MEAAMDDEVERGIDEDRAIQLRYRAAARAGFLRRFEMLSSGEVAALSRSGVDSALANRWRREARTFAVNVGGADRFPSFQFGDDGNPIPAMAEIIRLFAGRSPWALALWFAAPSGWLNGPSPAAVLRTDPASVVEAAERATEPLMV